MSLIIGALRAVFGADTASFEKGVDDVERKLKKAERKFKRFGDKLTGVGKAMSVGFTAPLVAIGALSFKTATDMAELESAFDVTFGNSSDSMREFAKDTADALGRSRREIQESSVAFASLFNKALAPGKANALTKEFAVLTQDLASFKNLSNEVAQQKLFSGLTGEAEPLRAVGVFINAAAVEAKAFELGLEKVNGKFTDQQKIVARARLIQEQLADANGDVARTYDSTANQLKRAEARFDDLQIVIGTKLLPVLTPMIEKIADGFEWFAQLDSGMQSNIIVTAAVVAGMGPLLGLLGKIITVGPSVLLVFTKITAGLASMGVATSVALGPITLIVGAVAAAVVAYKSFSPILKSHKEAREALNETLKNSQQVRAQDKATTLEGARAHLAAAKAVREELKARLEADEALLKKQAKSFGKAGALRTSPLAGIGVLLQKKGAGALAETGKAVAATREELAKTSDTIVDLEAHLDSLGGTTTTVTTTTVDLAEERKKAEKAAKELAKETERLAEAHADVKKATADELVENKLLTEAMQVSQREYEIVAEKLKLVEDGFKGTDAEARALAVSLVESRDKLDAVKQAANDNAAALAEQDRQIKAVADAMAKSVKDAVDAHDKLKKSHADEIENNRLLTEAMRVSSREYEIVSAQLQIMANGFLGTRQEARAMAEELVRSREGLSKVTDETKKTEDALKKTGKTGVDAFTDATNSFNSFLSAIGSGDLEGILGGIGGLLGNIFGEGGDSGGGGFGDILGSIGGIFGGGKATGGPVAKGITYLVGEEGPELFTPPSAGNIVPNDKLGGVTRIEIDPGPMFSSTVRKEAAGVAAPIAEVTTTRGVQQYNRSKDRSRKQRLA